MFSEADSWRCRCDMGHLMHSLHAACTDNRLLKASFAAPASNLSAELLINSFANASSGVGAGVGFDPQALITSTSGLAGMRERVLLLGSNLTIEAAPRARTRVAAEWLLKNQARRRSHVRDHRAGGRS
jgi:hypothetical protein